MDASQELQQALSRMISDRVPVQVFPATVKSVNDMVGTCDVEAFDELDIYDVRLRASINGELSEFMVLPTIGSSVLVANIGNSATEFVVVSYSEVDELIFKTGDTKVVALLEALRAAK